MKFRILWKHLLLTTQSWRNIALEPNYSHSVDMQLFELSVYPGIVIKQKLRLPGCLDESPLCVFQFWRILQ